MKGGSDLVKYMTEQFITYMETPSETRKQAKTSAKAAKEPWLTRWFGFGGMSLMMWWRGRSGRQR
ncbi:YqzE family protein [Paenibacillus sp. PAMC21692]|uniref:YqzE family protein n=1 Tax=Paenibacillus sp. PAMC21692 TaxID=2762320 RepID=UPI00164D04A9|nr:YqzE family protein [Paenibacillus sp. PAMC21692]QNK54447.1 YqzE family protein [Paenibacillus sp. PAMC21692]